jgi:SAM-dependent methyltransferase
MSVTLSSLIERGKYRGMLRILVYNWSFYAVTLFVSVLAATLIRLFAIPTLVEALIGLGIACATFWSIASLAAAHYIYDGSKLCAWAWLSEKLPASPQRWANLHAGLDNASAVLHTIFSNAQATVLDIYDARAMPDVSIARARRFTPTAWPARSADFRALPLDDRACDALFLIFAAHEIRRPAARRRFFAELYRALKPGGVLMLVEHLRDGWNFLAFGPGCLHFLPRREWMRLAQGAGFRVREEFSITPFVSVFILRRPL